MTPFETSREIPVTPEQIFAAISAPERLERWWGPTGFTNTSTTCEVKTGGRWSLTMFSPDGKHFANEIVFEEVDSPRKLVVHHVSKPHYRLTITLTPTESGTVVGWSQLFEDEEIARRVEHIVVPANDQNLERLAAEVSGKPVND